MDMNGSHFLADRNIQSDFTSIFKVKFSKVEGGSPSVQFNLHTYWLHIYSIQNCKFICNIFFKNLLDTNKYIRHKIGEFEL